MSTLATAREYLECAVSQARSRADYHAIGERICEIMEMQELEECRQLRAVREGRPEIMDRPSTKRPCQFCGGASPARPKHQGMYICESHQVLKQAWDRERIEAQEALERSEIAARFHERQAKRRAEAS